MEREITVPQEKLPGKDQQDCRCSGGDTPAAPSCVARPTIDSFYLEMVRNSKIPAAGRTTILFVGDFLSYLYLNINYCYFSAPGTLLVLSMKNSGFSKPETLPHAVACQFYLTIQTN